MRRHLRSTLFPYTTLFRSRERDRRPTGARVRVSPRRARASARHPSDNLMGETGRRLVYRSALRLLNRAGCRLVLAGPAIGLRSEEHTSELQSLAYLVCRLL